MKKSGMSSMPNASRYTLNMQIRLWRDKVKHAFLAGYIDHEACREFAHFLATAAIDDIAKEAEQALAHVVGAEEGTEAPSKREDN